MTELLKERLKQMESERYQYTTRNGIVVLLQRLTHNYMWYVVYCNQIINWGQYRNDLEEWCDMALEEDVDFDFCCAVCGTGFNKDEFNSKCPKCNK